jgi:hypothetical protein
VRNKEKRPFFYKKIYIYVFFCYLLFVFLLICGFVFETVYPPFFAYVVDFLLYKFVFFLEPI